MYKKIDANQHVVVKTLRDFGASVDPRTAKLGKGFPDLVVGFRGHNYLFEIKKKNGKLTPDQQKFIDEWRGRVSIVNCAEDALNIVFGGKLI